MSELAGQRITGTPLSERELYARSIEAIHVLQNCYRGLAHARNDMKWLIPVQLMNRLEGQTRAMMNRREKKLLWMPERTGRP